jgi:hypothetical protein
LAEIAKPADADRLRAIVETRVALSDLTLGGTPGDIGRGGAGFALRAA